MDENRKHIRDLIAANAGALAGNLRNLWVRSIEDLQDGGVDLAALADAMFDVGLTYKIAIEGKHRTVETLRAVTDMLEEKLPDAAPRRAAKSGRPN
ncbi:hypothetical protein [Bradyrhizobium sp. CW1]|uniref:hypothetical protein n=1 Tax=Bradyrhizobium sp. CW1 TaxID=2782686 RepID=UPI001FFFFCFA|nr:hypothetical protein [Bradyrhizobium sp. CW1]UPJ27078.1 hypothetical protein IVB54_36640 [Bradyrhizobium sp. CW1]